MRVTRSNEKESVSFLNTRRAEKRKIVLFLGETSE